MKTAAFTLCILACSLLPALHCRAEDKQSLSLEFVSCDTDGNLHVKLVNKADKPLKIWKGDMIDISDNLRIISIDPTENSLPYLWKKHLPIGSRMGDSITIAPQESFDCKLNLYGNEWIFGKRTAASDFQPDEFAKSPNAITKKLLDGDELIIVYQEVYPILGCWSGTLFCHGKVSSKPKSE